MEIKALQTISGYAECGSTATPTCRTWSWGGFTKSRGLTVLKTTFQGLLTQGLKTAQLWSPLRLSTRVTLKYFRVQKSKQEKFTKRPSTLWT